MIKSGKLNNIESDFEKEEQAIAEVQKKKIVKRIAENKVRQIKMKIQSQKKKNSQLDQELDDAKKTIREKQEQNEQLSKRAKELKGMIVVRKNSHNYSQIKTPASPKLSDGEKAEL
jgi:SMC interacting uncharacterized protein involved in chromosome segregation